MTDKLSHSHRELVLWLQFFSLNNTLTRNVILILTDFLPQRMGGIKRLKGASAANR